MLDRLTKLPGRWCFFQDLEDSVAQVQTAPGVLGLLIVEVRKLRKINSELGYHVGDLVLAELSSRLADCLRPSDILARIGDSEFALILPSLIGVGQAVLAANKICEISKVPFDVGGQSIRVRVAIGVALCPDHAGDSMHLMFCAESALSTARTLAEGHAVYSCEQDIETVSALALEADQLEPGAGPAGYLYRNRRAVGAYPPAYTAHPE